MVRVLGNSPERIIIADLGDVIYYKQEKEYTDQQYSSSRDLQRAIRRGNLSVLEKVKTPSNSGNGRSFSMGSNASVNLNDIKQAVKEVIPEVLPNDSNRTIRDAIREAIPLIVNMVRQEVSSLVRGSGISEAPKAPKTSFTGPEYIPDVSTEGMGAT